LFRAGCRGYQTAQVSGTNLSFLSVALCVRHPNTGNNNSHQAGQDDEAAP